MPSMSEKNVYLVPLASWVRARKWIANPETGASHKVKGLKGSRCILRPSFGDRT